MNGRLRTAPGLTLSGIARPTLPVATPATDPSPSLQQAGEGAIARGGGMDGARWIRLRGCMAKRPNVLFILTDQQTRMAMGAYGNPYVSTPNLDGLAEGGIRFERSYCASPVCSPSRSCLFTGRMAHETGVEVNGQKIREGIPYLGEVFREGGYEACYVGKWHMGERRGFDFPGPEYPEGVKRGFGSETDSIWADEAIEFLKQPHDKPFLLVVSLHNPHDICHWIMNQNPAVEEPKEGELPPLPPNFEPDPEEPEFITNRREMTHYGNEANWTTDWDETDWRRYLHAYYKLTERVDKEAGRVLGALQEAGLAEDTLVVFTSDHGEGAAGHKWVVKLMLYEEPVTVPFVIRYPGVIEEGAVDVSHLVSGVDVLPTLCDFAGVKPPGKVTGNSLKPIIENPSAPWRDYLVAELASDTDRLEMKGRMVRTDRYKYMVFSEGRNPELLFDMHQDPGEQHNLAYKPEFQSELRQQQSLLRAWGEENADTFEFPEDIV